MQPLRRKWLFYFPPLQGVTWRAEGSKAVSLFVFWVCCSEWPTGWQNCSSHPLRRPVCPGASVLQGGVQVNLLIPDKETHTHTPWLDKAKDALCPALVAAARLLQLPSIPFLSSFRNFLPRKETVAPPGAQMEPWAPWSSRQPWCYGYSNGVGKWL